MASTLTLTFSNSIDILLNQTLNIRVNTGVSIISLSEVFVSSRTTNGQVELNTPYDVDITASDFADFFTNDYSNTGSSSNLIANSFGSICIITLNNGSWQFETPTGTTINSNAVTYVINNEPATVEKTVTIDSYSSNAISECTVTDVNITATGGAAPYNAYVNDVLSVSAQSSPFVVSVVRSNSVSIRVTDAIDTLIGTVTTIPNRRLFSGDITTTVSNLSGGATINVSVAFISTDVSVYEYSLNGVNYQSSNIFSGQSSGTYTIYVKDGFGCVTSKQVIIDGSTTITETVFTISEINSLRYALIDNEKKNQKNTLSFNQLRINTYPYFQQYLDNEVIPTQFKTNAQYISCYTINKQGAKTVLTPIKKTENIGLKAKSTSTYFDLGNGRSGIYFGVVDTLDYLTNAVIETVNYGFALPEWANKEGDLVTIDGIGQVPINSIGYSEEKNSFVLEFNISYVGSDVEKIISAEYNLQPYEVYEFQTTVIEDCFNVAIEVGIDSNNINFTYLSESIKKVEDSEFLFDITYWDDENKGQMNYQTGIRHKLRLNGYQDDIGEQETEGYNGDTEFYVTDNAVYDVQSFKFQRLSTEMANKLRLVVAHKNLIINGLYYRLAEVPEVSGNGNYNLKIFSVNLKQSGEQFLTTEQENISNTPIDSEIGIALASAKNKGILAWSKNI